jgi:DNA invertase Pin-like site-specific DNA recombinase
MLARIEAGDIDYLIGYDVSRLGRHYRVLGTMANSLDIARQNRSQGEVQVWEASKHTVLTGTMLGLMVAIAQEENETRARRFRMGVEGTLRQNRWPTIYKGWGYTSFSEPGKRGHRIEPGPPEDVQMIKDIFNWAERGQGTNVIGRKLRARGVMLDERNLSRLLRNPAYKGELTYTFADGAAITIQIPALVSPAQWERVQAQRVQNRVLAQRNTKWVFLAQHIAYCGICGRSLTVQSQHFQYYRKKNGEMSRYSREVPIVYYVCNRILDSHEHPRWPGKKIDALIWDTLAGVIRDNPDEIIRQTVAKAKALQAEGDDLTGRIGQYRQHLAELDKAELSYNRQLGRGKLSEAKFDVLMDELAAARRQITGELDQLITLRDETDKVQTAIDRARQLLAQFCRRMNEINISDDRLRQLPLDTHREILRRRRQLVRVLADKITLYPDRLEISGAIGDKIVLLVDCQSLG